MQIAFLVNSLESLNPGYTTIRLAMEATNRGHSVWIVPSNGFRLDEEDRVLASGVKAVRKKYKSTKVYLRSLKSAFSKPDDITISDLDVLFLRGNPFQDKIEKNWQLDVGIFFGRLAMRSGVIVVNDPGGLGKAINESYLDLFPQVVRPVNIISRDRNEIRAFARKWGKIILRPLRWSPEAEEFIIGEGDWHNLNQIVESLAKGGYIIAQEFLPEASDGYIKLFMLDGQPLKKRGRYAAFKVKKRGSEKTFKAVKLKEEVLNLTEIIRPKLIKDGIFFAGFKIAGNKIMEINVFCPSGLDTAEKLEKLNFSADVIAHLERKVETLKCYGHDFGNAEVAAEF